MPAKVKTVNPPPKAAPIAPSQAPAPKALCHDQLCDRLTIPGVHPKSQIRVRMTMLDPLFGFKKEVYFSVRDVIITVADNKKPDLVELVVQ